jgi:hypothetical protein
MIWGIFVLQDSTLAGLRQAVWVPIENTLFAIIKIILLIVFAIPFQQYGIFAAWTISVVLTLIPVNYLIFVRLLPKHIEATKDKAVSVSRGEIGKYIAGNYLNALLGYMSTLLLPIIIVDVVGATANAYFAQAWLIASSLQLIASGLTASFTVEATLDRTKFALYSRRIIINMLGLIVPLVVIVILAGPLLLELWGHIYAQEGVVLLQLLALSAVPNIINYAYLGIARVRNRIVGLVLVQGAVTFLGLGLGYALLKIDGITGVGWAMLISQTVVAAVLLATEMRSIVFVPSSTPVDGSPA